jgi:hypothetical protein
MQSKRSRNARTDSIRAELALTVDRAIMIGVSSPLFARRWAAPLKDWIRSRGT